MVGALASTKGFCHFDQAQARGEISTAFSCEAEASGFREAACKARREAKLCEFREALVTLALLTRSLDFARDDGNTLEMTITKQKGN